MIHQDATLEYEKAFALELGDRHTGRDDKKIFIAGMDEVGRGALAGPVTVGITMVAPLATEPLAGLRDSKNLSARVRESLAARINDWSYAFTADALATEIDEFGLSVALGLAGLRALEKLVVVTNTIPDGLILDGNSNWLASVPHHLIPGSLQLDPKNWSIQTMVKADATCATVAAAAIVAKVARDKYMKKLGEKYPAYGWDTNKGYGSQKHREALTKYGSTPDHRNSWNLGQVSTRVSQVPLELWN